MEEERQQQHGARHTADGEEHVNVVVAAVAVEEKQQQEVRTVCRPVCVRCGLDLLASLYLNVGIGIDRCGYSNG
jgi:hypothetical protein